MTRVSVEPEGPEARILITGAAGCVGQYTAEHLYRHSDAHLLLLLRDPSKLKAVPRDDPQIGRAHV